MDVGVCTITHRTAELEESGTEPTSSNRAAPAAEAERNHHPHHATEGPRVRPPQGAALFIGRENAQVRAVGADRVVGANVVPWCGIRSMPAQRDRRLLPQDDRCRGGVEGQVSRIVIVVGICTSHISTVFIAFAFECFGFVCRG